MVRGTIPRQPSKAGRQDGVARQPRQAESRGRSREVNRTEKKTAPLPGAAPKRAPAAKKPPAYNPLAPERIAAILRALDQTYPAATCALHHRSAWELLVATILSAQCTDARVNLVTPELFRKYPTVGDFARLTPEDLQPEIRSTGFFRNKAKAIVGAAQRITGDFHGQVPDRMEQLLDLPGVARKTANVVLGTWFGKAEGVVVDTHVQRIAQRLELSTHGDPGKIEQDLMGILPRDRWTLFAHQLILHGRALCLARKPKCADCPLETLCHSADKTWSTVETLRTRSKK
jgi:endonuclease-3